MTRDELKNKMLDQLRDAGTMLDVDTFDHSQSMEDQGMDSLDNSTFLLAIEEAMNVKVADEDIEKLVSFDNYVDYVLANI